MKRKNWLGAMISILSLIVLVGCSKNPASVDNNANDEAIRQLVEDNMDYITSAGLDDNGAQPIEYDFGSLGKVSTEITPLKFGRRGQFLLQNIDVEYLEDGTALATITYSFDGSFFILAYDPDSIAIGKLYKKEMKNTVTRQAIFKKIGNTDHPRRNWQLRRVSGSELKSPDTNLGFSYVKIETSNGHTWEITDPFAFVNDLESVPQFQPGETVKVSVKIEGAVPDTVVLRYRNDRGMHRARKAFRDDGQGVDEVAGDGIYTGEWIVGQRRGIYHAFADAFGPGCIKDDVSHYDALAWGFPYIVKN